MSGRKTLTFNYPLFLLLFVTPADTRADCFCPVFLLLFNLGHELAVLLVFEDRGLMNLSSSSG